MQHVRSCHTTISLYSSPPPFAADARKILRKREETIPAMVQLLNPEEDLVVHEYAALCLAEMAHDFTGKVLINDNDGMEALIRCLSANDPDVQKNGVETIALMLQVGGEGVVVSCGEGREWEE
jgi:hypothetical protein